VWFLRRALFRLRKKAPYHCQRSLLLEEAQLSHWVSLSALDYIKQHHLQGLHENFIHPLLRATLFTTVEKVNAFYYLATLMPLLTRTYEADYDQTLQKLTSGIEDKILRDTVIRIVQEGDFFRVHTLLRTLTAQALVMATPLCDYSKIFQEMPFLDRSTFYEAPVDVFHVEGQRKTPFQNARILMGSLDQDVFCM